MQIQGGAAWRDNDAANGGVLAELRGLADDGDTKGRPRKDRRQTGGAERSGSGAPAPPADAAPQSGGTAVEQGNGRSGVQGDFRGDEGEGEEDLEEYQLPDALRQELSPEGAPVLDEEFLPLAAEPLVLAGVAAVSASSVSTSASSTSAPAAASSSNSRSRREPPSETDWLAIDEAIRTLPGQQWHAVCVPDGRGVEKQVGEIQVVGQLVYQAVAKCFFIGPAPGCADGGWRKSLPSNWRGCLLSGSLQGRIAPHLKRTWGCRKNECIGEWPETSFDDDATGGA